MRQLTAILGGAALAGGLAVAWVQAADPNSAAPLPFQPGAARPLDATGDFEPRDSTIDPQVRQSAATETPYVAARRTGGLAGRLKALRSTDNTAPVASAPAATETTSSEPDVALPPPPVRAASQTRSAPATSASDAGAPTDSAGGGLNSVLKRPPATAPSVSDSPTITPSVRKPSELNAHRALSPPPAAATPAPTAPPPTRPIATTPSSTTIAPTTVGPRPQANAVTLSTGASAALVVETSGPKALVLGKPAIFTVAITNQGVHDASEVYVAVALPTHVQLSDVTGSVGDARATTENGQQRIIWQIPTLAGRGQQKLTLQMVPQAGQPVEMNVQWTMSPPSAVAAIEVQEPKLTMELKGPAELQYGESANYQIVLANPGTGDAEDVVVNVISADGSAGDAKRVGTLGAGQQKILEVNMTAAQVGAMKLHFAAASGSLSAEARETVTVRRAQLKAEFQGSGLVFAGSAGTYQVVVTNTGDAPAAKVDVGVLLPDGAEYVGGIDDARVKGNQVVWSTGPLAPGASAKFEFTCNLATAGNCELQMQALAGDLTTSAVTTTKVESVADLKLVVNDPLGPKPVGEEVTYELTITNRGTKAARKVAVVANFSTGVEPTSVSGGTAQIAGGQALFQPIASIEPGASVKLQVKGKADRPGSHIFRAEVRSTDPETRLASEQTTRFYGNATVKADDRDAAPVPTTGLRPTTTKKL